MAFLRTLFWIVLTIVVVVFAVHNWQPVEIQLFGNLVWETKLPVPMLIAFLLGFVPLYIWHRTTRWHQNKKRVAAERALAAAVGVPAVSPGPASAAPASPAGVTPLREDGTAPAEAD